MTMAVVGLAYGILVLALCVVPFVVSVVGFAGGAWLLATVAWWLRRSTTATVRDCELPSAQLLR